MGYLVGLCGYGQVGKDTAAQYMYGWRRMAFGDKMKEDLKVAIEKFYAKAHEYQMPKAEAREIIRPMLISYAEAMRKLEPNYWVNQLWSALSFQEKANIVITDVRNVNEVERILNPGFDYISLGIIYIHRPGYGPASKQEKESIEEIHERWPERFPIVVNDGTKEELGIKVIEVINYLLGNL